jgi:hypothetical protein
VTGWWMFLSFYENVLAFPAAIIVLVLLLRSRSMRRRALRAGLMVLVFLPHIQRFVGNHYFDYLCRTQAGEFIYRTVDNVEGILQMRPRDGSKDYFDRMRAGDIPEDPWGHTNVEAQHPEWLFVNASTKYEYLEATLRDRPNLVARYSDYDHRVGKPMRIEHAVTPRSKYGFRWTETTELARTFLRIYGGKIEVVELASGSVLAVTRGYVRMHPWRICPNSKTEELTYRFVSKVLKPRTTRDTRDRIQ